MVGPEVPKTQSRFDLLHLKLDDGRFAAAEMPPDAARQLASILQSAAATADNAGKNG
jgi:hypothetical protein